MSLSLVDYASSDDDHSLEEHCKTDNNPQNHTSPDPPSPPPANRPVLMPNRAPESIADCPNPSFELPDASELLNSSASSCAVTGNDHSSRVAAAMAANASRKREPGALPSSFPRSKFPRSPLLHSKNVPDTLGRSLVPPQLTGRSNVVTEDISKLFVKKSSKPSSQQGDF